jgi:L-seryl-tRNA(Ser) seleniumtransferase
MIWTKTPYGWRVMSQLSRLTSVEKLLQTDDAQGLSRYFGRPLTIQAIRATLETMRRSLRSDPTGEAPDVDAILGRTETLLQAWTSSSLRRVINATGVILHTNLGRAPLSKATIEAMRAIGDGYSNLELDLDTGKRGQRWLHAEDTIQKLTGAQAAAVVNNNAAAVLLVLSALANRKRVAIARSQLVEIGGGFRMPDVMRQSGAKLVEVGTTNKVHLHDYVEVFDDVSVILRAHRSNFTMVGFTEEPEFPSIVDAAHQAGLIVVDDLGSGALLDTADYGMAHEPTVQESIVAGADVVCFSGDKLLGGPQAGIIVGSVDSLTKVRRHPLARVVRADKITLAGISATLQHYLLDEAVREIPVWRMIAMPAEEARARAQEWAGELGIGDVLAGESTLGGGSLPGEMLPTFTLSLNVGDSADCLGRLRKQDLPIIARTEKGRILLDPRTVLPDEDGALTSGVHAALRQGP